MRISVVIPTCDRPALLAEAIECVSGQTRPPDEVIVVNNGAAPPPIADPDVRLLHLAPMVGPSAARNHGAEAASAELLAFLDDDDLWEPDYLRKMEEVLSEGADAAVARLDQISDGRLEPMKRVTRLQPSDLFVRNPGINGSNIVVRREAFLAVGGYDVSLRLGEDKGLVLDLLLNGFAVQPAPHVQSIFRHHSGSRLSNTPTLVAEAKRFLAKYRPVMPARYRFDSRRKIARYRFRSRAHPIALVLYGANLAGAFICQVGEEARARVRRPGPAPPRSRST